MAPPSKRLKRAKVALSATRVLNCNTPILTQDIHSFITTALSPAYWSQYSEAEKRKLIDLFPVAYRKYHTDENGKLECPVTMEFLQSDPYVKAGMARFKRDVEAGCWEAKWQEQARTAIQERKEGKFDEYLKEHVEECFGEENAGDGPEEDEEQRGFKVRCSGRGGNDRDHDDSTAEGRPRPYQQRDSSFAWTGQLPMFCSEYRYRR